jgi:hypothetical protein
LRAEILGTPNLKPLRLTSGEIAARGLALSFQRQALVLHSNSSALKRNLKTKN